MLDFMRRNAGSKIVWLIMGAIILVFVFFGVGGDPGGAPSLSVGGQKLAYNDFLRILQVQRENFGPPAEGEDPAQHEKLLRQRTVDLLVNRMLAVRFGQTLGFDNSSQALIEPLQALIKNNPMFQVNGVFDQKRYADAVTAAFRTTPLAFEQELRDTLVAMRVRTLVAGLAAAPAAEVKNTFHFMQDQLAVDYVFFPSLAYADGLAASQAELSEFFTAHRENWRRPERIQVEYVEIQPADFMGQVRVTDEDLETAYAENQARFTTPEEAEVSHILLQFANPNPTEEEKAETLAKAREVLDKAKTENFADLAREYSQDPGTAAQGGSLGRIGRGWLAELPALEEAVWKAPEGQVAGPLETPAGYDLVLVSKRRPARLQPLAEVRDTLNDELRAEQARDLARETMENLISRAEINPQLADAAKSLNLEFKTSGLFTQTAPADFFNGQPAKLAEAFKLSVGELGGTVETPDLLVLYKVAAREESRAPELEEVQASVSEAWTLEQSSRLAEAAAKQCLEDMRAQGGWAAGLAGLPASARQGRSAAFARTQFENVDEFKSVNRDEMIAAVLSLARVGDVADRVVYSEPQPETAGYYLFSLAEQATADEAAFAELEPFLVMPLKRAAGEALYRNFMESLLRSAQVEVPRAMIEATY